MKRTTSALALGISATVATSIAFAGMAFAAPGGTPGPNGAPAPVASASQAPASDSLRLDLTYLREEERLARDVYAALAAKYDGARPFATITDAEQRHFDAVGVLLSRYGIADPSAGLAAGTYAYVADTNSAGQGFVHVIDTATNTAIRYLPVSIDSGAFWTDTRSFTGLPYSASSLRAAAGSNFG